MGRLPGAWSSCLWTPPAIVGADPCWQAMGLRVGAGQRLLGGPGTPAHRQAPALPPAHLCCRAGCGAAHAVWCPTCRGSSGGVVSAVSGGKEGWLVPCWPQGHPDTHRFCWHYTALQPRQLPLCPLPGCKRVIRAGRQRCGSEARRDVCVDSGCWACLSPAPFGCRAEPGPTRARDGHTCGRLCMTSTARGAGRGALGPRGQEGPRVPVASSCEAVDGPGGRRQGAGG